MHCLRAKGAGRGQVLVDNEGGSLPTAYCLLFPALEVAACGRLLLQGFAPHGNVLVIQCCCLGRWGASPNRRSPSLTTLSLLHRLASLHPRVSRAEVARTARLWSSQTGRMQYGHQC